MFLKKLGGVRIVGRERGKRSHREKQTESHRVPHLAFLTWRSSPTDHVSDVFFILGADILSDVVPGI
jgi:hypothetical protein